MLEQFSRTELIIGKEAIEKLNNSKVAVFGIGGVGSFVIEGLVRAGIQNFILVDSDVVDITNLNRQLIATHNTVGKDKVEVCKERILSINPNAKVEVYKEFFEPENTSIKLDNSISYIVDAIDTVTFELFNDESPVITPNSSSAFSIIKPKSSIVEITAFIIFSLLLVSYILAW